MATPLGKYKRVKLELKMKALDAIILDVWKPPGMSRWCMHGDDDHLAWKRPVFLEACRGLRTVGGSIDTFGLGSTYWIRVGGRLIRTLDQSTRDQIKGMDSKIVTVDQFAMVMASIQEAIASLSRMIDGQQVSPQDGAHRSKYARREERRKEKQSEENRGQAAAVFLRTFGALPEVHFLHSIYHFKAQEVKNPMLQTVHDSELKRRSYSHFKQITPKCCEISLLLREFRSLFVQCYGIPPEATRYMPQAGTLRTSSQPNSEDFSTEDERLSFLSLGVRKARQVISNHGNALVYPCEPLVGDFKVINFVDYSLNQGAPAGHKSAETPIGHESKWRRCRGSNLESNGAVATAAARDESNGAVAGDGATLQ
ncbi:hypothetical protein CK203_016388 [Vitis vinifera]|uniref:Uncharacterized protein n=1 Tax=Vitis vinifera TaxID=29760 RepID=A0A438J1F2_VITVI|nr:hypothetical protein CK203_016388 [Vitis vinifera]